jgi:uncharacterized protein YecT (DUF1311 family)
MLKKLALLFAVLILLPAASRSQSQKKHPIDRALEACITRDSTTAGMTKCADKALEMWDKELNRVYNDLAAKLDPKGKQSLKTAQIDWIKFRDSEYGLIDFVYSRMEGTMYIPMRVEARADVVRKRAVALKDYLDLLKDQ